MGSERAFAVGDTVQLKSGGPKMTVEAVNRDQVQCTWFNRAKRVYGDFDPRQLQHVDPVKGG